jgi:uncharacterized protein (DUF433 family)
MTANAHNLLAAFDALAPDERRQVAAEILRRAATAGELPEEALDELAAELFPGHDAGAPALEYPSIVSTPSVCGGAARLIRTRIPVWTLERMRQLGVSEVDVLRSYPTLRAADLVQVWSYADRHRAEIDRVIQENEEG